MELFIFYLKYKKSVLSSRIEYLPFSQHYVWDDSTDTERKKKKEKEKKITYRKLLQNFNANYRMPSETFHRNKRVR